MVSLYNTNSFGINKLSTASSNSIDSSSNQGGGGGRNFYQADETDYNDSNYVDTYDSDTQHVLINQPFDPNLITQLNPHQIETLIAAEISFREDLENNEDDNENNDDDDSNDENELSSHDSIYKNKKIKKNNYNLPQSLQQKGS